MPGCAMPNSDAMTCAIMVPADMRQGEFGCVLVEHLDHAPNLRIGDSGRTERSVDGWEVMVGHRQMLLRAAGLASFDPQLVEGEKGLPFIDQIEIDIEEIFA